MKPVYIPLFFLLLITIACNDGDTGDKFEVIVPVSVQEVTRGDIEAYSVTTADVMAAQKETQLALQEGYYQLNINPNTGLAFKTGDRVKKGQVVITLKNPESENTIALESKKLNLDISKREYEKQKSLYEKGGVTQRELINAERTFVDANYAYENAQLQLAKFSISSSFNGIITRLPYYTANVRIKTGDLMMETMDYQKMYADVTFPSKELKQVKKGQKVVVTQYNLPADTLYGQIDQVDPSLDAQSRSFSARISINNSQNILRPGMFVKLDVIIDKQSNTLVIPNDIVLSKRGNKTVFVVEKKAAEERRIVLGLVNDTQAEVLNGLKEGDKIVIKGFETLRHRSKVKIVR